MKIHLPKALMAALVAIAAAAPLAQADEPASPVWGYENGTPTKDGSAINYNKTVNDGNANPGETTKADNIKIQSSTATGDYGVGKTFVADTVWFSNARNKINTDVNGTTVTDKGDRCLQNANAVFVVGGQLWMDGATMDTPQVLIGHSDWSETGAGSDMSGAALRFSGGRIGKVALVEDAKIGIYGSGTTGTITNLNLNGYTLTEGDRGKLIVDGSLTGKGADGSKGTVRNVNMQLGNGAQVSDVTFDGSNGSVTLSDAAQVTMSDVAFTNGASVTVGDGQSLTLVNNNGTVTLGSGSTVNSNGITGTATSGTLTLTETSVASVSSVVDNAVTVDYTGLSGLAFADGATVGLDLTQGFILALQKEVMPDAAQILTINFGEAVDIRNATIGDVNIGGGFPTLATASIEGNSVVLTFKETNAIPEPATAALSLLALAGLAARRRRK